MKLKDNLILLKNKYNLYFNQFNFKCCIGKNGLTSKKIEGDQKTPIGTYKLGGLFYRKDRVKKPLTSILCKPIKKNMGWCNDFKDQNNYNKLVAIKKIPKSEKLFRLDYKYDYFIPILYNTKKRILKKGSAIFLHLTKNYKGTAGCIALKKSDFLILLKLINKNTKIKIN
jgi:L,D-peptidoglycan transpeptidase YkuD (ErfK/YbiS/YcfS/YnhG family)